MLNCIDERLLQRAVCLNRARTVLWGAKAKSKGGKAQMKIEIQAETVATVERERERERELLFIQRGIRLLDQVGR